MPGSIPPLVRLLLLALLGTALTVRADDLAEVQRLYYAGQASAAMQRADEFLNAHPKDAQMRFVKAVMLADARRDAEAISQFQKISEDSIARATSFYGEVDKLEAKGVERSAVAIDEVSVNFKETLAYGAQLGAEWRKLTLDAIKQSQAAFTPATKAS